MLVINENFPQNIQEENEIAFLLEQALKKQREQHSAFLQKKAEVNPLIIVQIPNKNEVMKDEIERWFEASGITYENGRLAVWLSKKHGNLEGIDHNDAPPVAVIIKQAVATGWDCPRAHILVKPRDNMNETFEIQTIGRIRRMPEAKHYGNDLLDSCYLYTLDEKFTEGVKMNLGKGALDAATLYLKPEFKQISLASGQKSGLAQPRDAAAALTAMAQYFAQTHHTGTNTAENRTRLETAGYVFSSDIVDYTKSGSVTTMDSGKFADLNTVNIWTKLGTHRHGREYHHRVAEIALRVGLEYAQMNTILRRLFDKNTKYANKLLALETREVYAFVLNNAQRIKQDVRQAMAVMLDQQLMEHPGFRPQSFISHSLVCSPMTERRSPRRRWERTCMRAIWPRQKNGLTRRRNLSVSAKTVTLWIASTRMATRARSISRSYIWTALASRNPSSWTTSSASRARYGSSKPKEVLTGRERARTSTSSRQRSLRF